MSEEERKIALKMSSRAEGVKFTITFEGWLFQKA